MGLSGESLVGHKGTSAFLQNEMGVHWVLSREATCSDLVFQGSLWLLYRDSLKRLRGEFSS